MSKRIFVFVAMFSLAMASIVAAQDPAPEGPAGQGRGRGSGVEGRGFQGRRGQGRRGQGRRGQGRRGRAFQNDPVPDTPPEPVERPANGPPLFTENFESGEINTKVWTAHVSGDQTISVTNERAAHGEHSLKASFPTGTSGMSSWAFLGTLLPEELRDHFYGRAYMYISGPAGAHNVYMNSGTTGFPIADFLEIGFNRGNLLVSYQQNAPAEGHPRSETTERQGVPPFGEWFLLEWEMTNEPENRIVLWVNGDLVANQAFTFNPVNPRDNDPENRKSSGLVPGGFTEFNVGFRAWSNGGPEDLNVYYDDIALGDKPIGPVETE